MDIVLDKKAKGHLASQERIGQHSNTHIDGDKSPTGIKLLGGRGHKDGLGRFEEDEEDDVIKAQIQ